MAAESNLWRCTRPRLLAAGYLCQRIETSTGDGVPDVWVGDGDGYAWLENKAARAWPARAGTPVFGREGLRPEQIAWHLNAARLRVHAYVWAGVGTGRARQTYLIPCKHAGEFNTMARADLERFVCPIDDLPGRIMLLHCGLPPRRL